MHGVMRNKLEKFVLWARVNLGSQESRGISIGRYQYFWDSVCLPVPVWGLACHSRDETLSMPGG